MAAEKSQLDQLRIEREDLSEKGSRWWIWVVLLLLLAGGYAAWVWLRPEAPEVETVLVEEAGATGTSRTVLNGSGYVTARRQATVSSKVTGKIIEVLIEEGMKVQDGQLLARLDTSNVEVSAQLADAQAAATRAARGETMALLEEARRELKRFEKLKENGISSQSELDSSMARVDSLQARLTAQDEEVKVAERQRAVWKQEMQDREVRAPFAGVVVAKNAQPGEMISPISAGGGFTRTGIGTIVDMSSLEIEVDVNESHINRVQPGQEVTATLDAYPDWAIPANVIAIIPAADRQKATVKVRIGFDKLDPRILPDMGVKVAFRGAEEAETGTGGVYVPKSAIYREGNQDIVWVVAGERLERRAVRVGPTRGEEVNVLAGLSAGERALVSGPAEKKDGMQVKEKKKP